MKTVICTFALVGFLSGCSTFVRPTNAQLAQPEGASGFELKTGWTGTKFAIAAANPLATEAGYNILKAGGSAADAAIAVQMVLTLVEPQSSGLGGGTFLLHFNGQQVEAFDGRETAPTNADENLFIGKDLKPITFAQAVVGGRSVGTPGTLRVLEMVHQQHGKLPWATLFDPAIALAENGFKISPRLHQLLSADPYLKNDPTARAYFYKANGTAHEAGYLLKNPPLAALLRKIASQGSNVFYQGDVAQTIVDKVQTHITNPGTLSLTDLENYKAIKRQPLCQDYAADQRDFRICGFPPPSSGAITVGQILGILNHTKAPTLNRENGLPSATWLHLYTEASRLAFADRAQYIADPDFIEAPGQDWMNLLNPLYLAERAQRIDPIEGNLRMKSAPPGQPGPEKIKHAAMPEQIEYGTSHISIVDAQGHAVAMTSTIEDGFGSRQMVNTHPEMIGGFLLNNELTDFSFTPKDSLGLPIANRVQPGKRPRSSMSPTLVFDKATGGLVMVSGSPGGALIIHYSAKVLYGVLNWGLTPQQAIDLPNFGALNETIFVEQGRFQSPITQALKAQGHAVIETQLTSGLQSITRRGLKPGAPWLGGADPRREGIVLGE
jgi:gamma-glutamyltranspeptidase/glutathione hydrolase